MNFKKIFLAVLAICLSSLAFGQSAKNKGYVIVTDYLKADGKKDVSDIIQRIIDNNPNRTIFFPDGVYMISKPINTPADPTKSVSLQLSNYAIIRAAEGWSHEEAMIRLGGKDPFNTIYVPGSNYYFDGGIVDGSGVATGISIDSGRETAIHNTSIKNVKVGIQINRGANNGSSDSDIHDVNIVGNKADDSVGVLVIGYDNTFSNMRIASVHYGFHIKSGGNSLRNIHPLYTINGYDRGEYATSCGFMDESGNNFYSFCYSDQFAIGFHLGPNVCSVFDSCFCFWYAGKAPWEKGVLADGMFNSIMNTLRVDFHRDSVKNVLLEVAEPGGRGVLSHPLVNRSRLSDFAYESYLG